MTDPSITLGAVNVEAADPVALARFWAGVLGSTPAVHGKYAELPPAGPGGVPMFFQPRQGPRSGDSPAHLDLTVPWLRRETEVARILALGATLRWDVLDEQPHVRWTTLADPEGNLFCIAEHPPAGTAT
jgi:hypothetical protein